MAALGGLLARQQRVLRSLGRTRAAERQEQSRTARELARQVGALRGRLEERGAAAGAEAGGAAHNVDYCGREMPAGDAARIMEALSGGVCLLQGEYVFVDPATGRPLRGAQEEERREGSAQPGARGAWSVGAAGPLLTVEYSATGFLVERRGYILTNRHVAAPWTVSREYRHILEAGYEGRLTVLRAYFPHQERGFDARVARLSEAGDDVAVLRAELGEAAIPVLPCAAGPGAIRAGETVIVLGYPAGFDAVLARLEPGRLEQLLPGGEGTMAQMAERLAAAGLIEPIGTRGMCGCVVGDRVVYDAGTAIGGSGGPVINGEGQVVAINTALLKGFAGTNVGIAVGKGLALLEGQGQAGEEVAAVSGEWGDLSH